MQEPQKGLFSTALSPTVPFYSSLQEFLSPSKALLLLLFMDQCFADFEDLSVLYFYFFEVRKAEATFSYSFLPTSRPFAIKFTCCSESENKTNPWPQFFHSISVSFFFNFISQVSVWCDAIDMSSFRAMKATQWWKEGIIKKKEKTHKQNDTRSHR
jgi:hypothetical protein